jgi:hypothetical protein
MNYLRGRYFRQAVLANIRIGEPVVFEVYINGPWTFLDPRKQLKELFSWLVGLEEELF